MDEKEKNRPEQPSEEPTSTPAPAPEEPAPTEAAPPAVEVSQPAQQPFTSPAAEPYRAPQMGSFQSPAPSPVPSPAPHPVPHPAPPPGPTPQSSYNQPSYNQPQYNQAAPQPPQPERRRSFVGPLILVFLGVMFLLNNLGLSTWSVWEILWRFWPVWLIAIGVEMLFGRRGRWGGLVALAIVLTMLGGLFYFGSLWTGFSYSQMAAPSERQTISQPLNDSKEARVEIKSGVSRLEIRGGAQTGALIEGAVTPVVGERLEQEFRGGTTAYYTLRSQFNGIQIPFGRRSGEGQWDLQLNGQIPMALTVETGVGKSTLDLSDLSITDLRINSGVGETTVTLPSTGQVRGRIQTGVGQTTLQIPDGMEARIRVETGIGGVSVRGDFIRDGSYYTTPGYESARERVDLEVEGGVGGIRIETGH